MSVDSFWSFRYPRHPIWDWFSWSPVEEATPVSEDYVSSPIMTYSWCPTCEPSKEPLDNLWEVCYCSEHSVPYTGEVSLPFASWDELPEFNSVAQCNFIHRGTKE